MGECVGERLNIKKKKISYPIFYGVDEITGDLVTVDEVERGLACNCTCPSCGTQLEARKGNKRSHHFAHEINKECLYGAEISMYKAFYKLLKHSMKFCIPDAIIENEFGRGSVVVKKGTMIELTDIKMYNDPIHYPPELVCYCGENRFRIILNIESYYNKDDFRIIKEYGIQHNLPIVSIELDKVGELSSYSTLQEYVDFPNHKTWIYNRKVESQRKKYQEELVKQKKYSKRKNYREERPLRGNNNVPIKYVDTVKQLEDENYNQEDYLIHYSYDKFDLRFMWCVRCNRPVPEEKIIKKQTLNKGVCCDCHLGKSNK